VTRFTRLRFATAAASCCALGAAAANPAAAAADTVTAAAAAVASVAIAAPLGLALARLRFSGRAFALAILVFASATPPALLDGAAAPLGASFVYNLAFGIPLAAWIIFLVARDWTPHIEDAARLDGAGPWHLWIPLLRPTATAAAVLVFLYGVFDLS
jgi:putative spermidine/putrescine transport system permease protein